ncbi:MAG: GDP-mannose 4,6-dehydratase [Solirubrobacteraceae bacterium MAG38_C4-C5]|nr:GDP-mannose 4,6-dehydratase [Candidatus Siliceabacter maunaloa]
MRALVTGIGGQDGSYLAEQLLTDGHEVVGMVRGDAHRALPGPAAVRERVTLVTGDLLDPSSLTAALETARPQVVFHLAAPSFVPASWEDPAQAVAAIAGATGALLEAARRQDPSIRIVIASSAAIFGDADETPQREATRPRPATPYAIAKLAAHQLVGAMRERHGLHASSAIAYNHESVRRPERFVTRKVTRGAARIAAGLEEELALGDLDAVRDWSDARDIVAGLRLMAAADDPGDYVLASGVGRTVGDLVAAAFAVVGLDPAEHVRTDPRFVRGPETTPSVGDPTKARERLGWRPEHSFEDLIRTMVEADLAATRAAAR